MKHNYTVANSSRTIKTLKRAGIACGVLIALLLGAISIQCPDFVPCWVGYICYKITFTPITASNYVSYIAPQRVMCSDSGNLVSPVQSSMTSHRYYEDKYHLQGDSCQFSVKNDNEYPPPHFRRSCHNFCDDMGSVYCYTYDFNIPGFVLRQSIPATIPDDGISWEVPHGGIYTASITRYYPKKLFGIFDIYMPPIVCISKTSGMTYLEYKGLSETWEGGQTFIMPFTNSAYVVNTEHDIPFEGEGTRFCPFCHGTLVKEP